MSIDILYEAESINGESNSNIDIIAIHGLNPKHKDGHALKTWTHESKSGKKFLWLKDSLPKRLPSARIMMYSYNSKPVFATSKDRFVHEASQFLERLSVKRLKDPKRPLVLIGHSLGGILIKQVLVNAHANPRHADIIDSTFALIFMGTPHNGPADSMKVEIGKACAKVVKSVYDHPSNDLLEALENGSLFSDILKENWRHQLERYQIISVYETKHVVVPCHSAVLHLPGTKERVLARNTTHSDVCRFNIEDRESLDDLDWLESNLETMCCDVLQEVTKNQNIRTAMALNDEILESLGKFGRNPRYNDIELGHPETMNWIWVSKENEGPGLQQWFYSSENLFWISGKPGAGKSTIVKHIFDKLSGQLRKNQNKENVIISFFFYELGLPSERTISGMLHALLFQLLTVAPELSIHIQAQYLELKKRSMGILENASMWTAIELQRAFDDILKGHAEELGILCLIDGIDECDSKDLRQILSFLMNMSMPKFESQVLFKLVCSSRPENAIELAFGRYSMVKIQEHTATGIEKYVRETLEEIAGTLYPLDAESLRSEHLIFNITRRAEGVFIWARAVMAELIPLIESGDIELLDATVDQCPGDLEALYRRIVSKVPPGIRHETHNFLQLLRTNTGLQQKTLIGIAIGMQPSSDALASPVISLTNDDIIGMCCRAKRKLQDRCRGFISVPSLRHNWTQEEVLANFCWTKIDVHKTVYECLFPKDQEPGEVLGADRNKLEPEYVQSVAFLFRLLKIEPFNPDFTGGDSLLGVLYYLLWMLRECEKNQETAIGQAWLPAILKRAETIRKGNIRYLYDMNCDAGLPRIDGWEEPEMWEGWTPTPLSIAMIWRIYSYVDFETRGVLNLYAEPRPLLHSALSIANNGQNQLYIDFLRRLMSQGYEPERQINSRTTWEYYLRALLVTSDCATHDNQHEVVLLFLEFNSDPNQHVRGENNYQCSVLHVLLQVSYLFGSNLELVIRALLSKGARVDAIDSNGRSVVQLAEKNSPQAVAVLKEYS